MLTLNTLNTASAAILVKPPDNGVPPVAASNTKPVQVELQNVAPQAVAEQKLAADAKSSVTQLQSAVDNINKLLLQQNVGIEFSIDSDTKQTVVKVKDSKTGDLIKQFPSEEALEISKAIDHKIQRGLLLNQKA